MISYLKNWNHFWANKKKEMCEYDVLWSGIVRHALRNAVLPCMTLMATNLSGLICGSFAFETIFSWNGIGKFAVESVKAKDLPVGWMLGRLCYRLILPPSPAVRSCRALSRRLRSRGGPSRGSRR